MKITLNITQSELKDIVEVMIAIEQRHVIYSLGQDTEVKADPFAWLGTVNVLSRIEDECKRNCSK